MLKRIKIVTSLLLVLAVFGLLQLTSGGLFFNALKNDKENFTVLQTIRQQQSTLNITKAMSGWRMSPRPSAYGRSWRVFSKTRQIRVIWRAQTCLPSQ